MYVAVWNLSALCYNSCEEFFGREKFNIEIFLSTMSVQENPYNRPNLNKICIQFHLW